LRLDPQLIHQGFQGRLPQTGQFDQVPDTPRIQRLDLVR
jgi:hypothetical protein